MPRLRRAHRSEVSFRESKRVHALRCVACTPPCTNGSLARKRGRGAGPAARSVGKHVALAPNGDHEMPEKPRCSLWRGAQCFPALAAIEGVSGRREPAESVLEFEASKYPARRGQRSQRDARAAAAREAQSGVPIWRQHRIWRTS
jgi:hypothetical protein